MNRTQHLALGLVGLTMAMGAMACSDNNDLKEVDRPEFQLDEPVGAVLLLQLPEQPNRPRLQDNKLRMRSTGKADLNITSIKWIDQPQGVYIQKSRNDVDACAADCSSAICIQTASRDVCVETGFPDLPLTIPTGQLYDLQLFIAAGVDELNCPPAPANVPPIVGDDYCGAIEIKTDANNTGQNVENGTTIVYLTNAGTSGKLQLTEPFIDFAGVSPGFTAQRTFGIENIGSSPLTINTIQPNDRANFFEITGDFNVDIAPNSIKQYTVKLTVPMDAKPEELDFTTNLVIGSSAVNANLGKVVVRVKSGQSDAPKIKVDTSPLKFDQNADQELIVENVGETTLIVNSVSFEPSNIAKYYQVTMDGQPFDSSVNIQKPNVSDPERSKRTFKVAFTRPANDTGSATGKLIFNHNDDSTGKVSRIVVLGDAGDVPIAELLPYSFTFDLGNSDNQVRAFAIANFGTAPLNITGVEPTALQGTTDEYQLNLPMITIAPGAIYESSVLFQKANEAEDNISFKILSNTSGEPLLLSLASVSSTEAAPKAAIKTSFATKAKIGELTSFDASDSTPQSAISSARWILLARPEGSKAFLDGFGKTIGFTPDIAGTYRVALTITNSAFDAQDVKEFVAE